MMQTQKLRSNVPASTVMVTRTLFLLALFYQAKTNNNVQHSGVFKVMVAR